jgi:predicted TIM-barrel fold metal-dependent hydrolase
MQLIDVHHHIMPPAYAEVVGPRFQSRNEANAAQVMRWTPASSIEAKRLSRACNEFAAGMERDFPGRFGFFATVPMPDVDATLEEIRYAFDTLHADGVGLMSNYGRVWPGDPKFAPVFDEVNRRKAIVYVHPILPEACQDMMPGVGESAGGAMPPLAARVTRMADRDRKVAPKPAQSSMAEMKSLCFDVASSTNPVTLAGLLSLVPATQVMFGTDFPFLASIPYTADPLRSHGLGAADLEAIERGTALRLFPRFAKAMA